MSILCSMVGASFATVAAVAQILRSKKSIVANGNAQVDTAQSKFGGASAYFDGTGDALTIEHNGSMRFGTSDFTIEFWYRPNSRVQSYPVIFTNKNGFDAGNIVFHDRHNAVQSYLTIWIYNLSNSSPIFTATTATVNGTWYHIALTRSGTSLKLFVNGTQEGSTYTTSADIDVGAGSIPYYVSYPGSSSEYNGWVDEIRVSNTARYTANFTPATLPFNNDDNTLLLIHADGTDGSTYFEDDTGFRSQKGIVAVGNAQIDTAQSKFGGSSALFDGDNDLINTTTGEIFSSDFTMECWFRPTNTNATYRVAICNGTWTAAGAYSIGQYGSSVFVGYYGSGNDILSASSTVSANTWHHLAVVRSGTTVTLYVDGVSKGTATRTGNIGLGNGYYIGNLSGLSDDVIGHMDEIRVSNIARYTSAFTPSATPFVNDANTLLLIHADGTDGSTVFLDDNGIIGKNILAVGNAQIDTAQSKFGGSSALFDGTGDYLKVTPVNFSLSSDFTIEFWVRLNTKADQIFVNYYNGSNYMGHISFESNNGYGFLSYVDPSGFVLDAASGGLNYSSTNTGQWYHIAHTRQGNVYRHFVDGVLRDSTTRAGSLTIDQFTIGAQVGGTAGTNGWIDEFRVSNTARYIENFTPSTTPFVNDDNTVLLLHMDGADASTVFVDSASRTQKSIQALGNAQIDTAQSKFGSSSVLFDGTGDYLNVSTDPQLTLGDFTVELWYRASATNGALLPFFNTADHLFYIGYSGGNPVYDVFAGGSNRTTLTAISGWSLNTWYHAAFVRSGSTIKVYHNGTQVTTGTWGATVNTGNPNQIGVYSSYFFQGHMDEIRVSNTARYTENFTPSTTPFQNDKNTVLLIHGDGTDASTVFVDDNGKIPTVVSERVTPTGVNFERASSEKLAVKTFSTNVTERIQVASYWFKLSSNPTGDESILYGVYSSDQNAPILCELTGGKIRHYVHTGNGFTDMQYTPSSAFTPGTWYHIVTKSNSSGSGRRQVWLNGVRVLDQAADSLSASTYSVGNVGTNNYGYGIGGSPVSAARLFNGCIAQVYWYAGDIDIDSNISKFYNNGFVNMGPNGIASGLPTPHIFHNGSTQAEFDDVRGLIGGSSVTVTGTLGSCT